MIEPYDEGVAFICAAKGLPYTYEEWQREVARLQRALGDAMDRRDRAMDEGVCTPARFES